MKFLDKYTIYQSQHTDVGISRMHLHRLVGDKEAMKKARVDTIKKMIQLSGATWDEWEEFCYADSTEEKESKKRVVFKKAKGREEGNKQEGKKRFVFKKRKRRPIESGKAKSRFTFGRNR